jgi:hypothetical protein
MRLAKLWELMVSEETSISIDFLHTEQHDRLVSMRRKNEHRPEVPKDPLPLRANAQTRNAYRKGHAHWFATSIEDTKETIYEDVLMRLSTSTQASTLFEYEKQWAQNAIRHVKMDAYADHMIGAPQPKLLEQRIEALDKKLINTSLETPCENEFATLLGADETAPDLLAIEDALAVFNRMESNQQPCKLITMRKEEDLVDLEELEILKEKSKSHLALVIGAIAQIETAETAIPKSNPKPNDLVRGTCTNLFDLLYADDTEDLEDFGDTAVGF